MRKLAVLDFAFATVMLDLKTLVPLQRFVTTLCVTALFRVVFVHCVPRVVLLGNKINCSVPVTIKLVMIKSTGVTAVIDLEK